MVTDEINNALVSSQRFVFDEAMFRDYFELHFRPHDKASGWKFMWLFFFVFAIWFSLALWVVWWWVDGTDVPDLAENPLWYTALVVMPVFNACCMFYGFRMWRGFRHPRWGTPRWEARTNAAFRMLAKGGTKKPLYSTSQSSLPVAYFVMIWAWFGASWYDQPLFYDFFPGLLPTVADLDPLSSEDTPVRKISFEVRFYTDRVEKGSPGSAVSFPYGEVHDIVEDSRFPGLAILRIKDESSEIVVATDQLEGESWGGVKARIAKVNNWITLREALFGQ